MPRRTDAPSVGHTHHCRPGARPPAGGGGTLQKGAPRTAPGGGRTVRSAGRTADRVEAWESLFGPPFSLGFGSALGAVIGAAVLDAIAAVVGVDDALGQVEADGVARPRTGGLGDLTLAGRVFLGGGVCAR